jgi:hypothetical protein
MDHNEPREPAGAFEEWFVTAFPDAGLVPPDEWIARNIHYCVTSSFALREYLNPELDAWMRQVEAIILAPGLEKRIKELREQYLTAEEIAFALDYDPL